MKTEEEIEKLANEYAKQFDYASSSSPFLDYIEGYNQCQEDMAKKYTEEDVINIVNKSRETGLTAEYLMYLKRIY